ncbi:MAG TPA: FtsX-like permease family protein [Tepidisphaeraceae bacterium]|jgi:lipoprotein-releasing system permease protein|nr:FtsX-like permease family protein [Tepidisphaeraceae bacterium]
MYKLLLIQKYLIKRRIAWVSLAAVMMCVVMVLVVISVMGGWLRMFEQSFRGLSGDVIVQGTQLRGFAKYEQILEGVEKLPGVAAAIPVVRTFAVINIDDQQSPGVQVIGYPIDKVGRVNNFPESLYLQYGQYIEEADDKTNDLTDAQRAELRRKAEELRKSPSFALPLPAEAYLERFPNAPKRPDGTYRNDPASWTGMIAGSGVLDIRKDKQGKIIGREEFLYRLPVTMTMPRISASNRIENTGTVGRNYWIVDDSRTKLWQYDSSTVYVPFEVLQQDLGMGQQTYTDRETGEKGIEPARAHEINVRIKPGADLQAVRDEIEGVVMDVQGLPRDALAVSGPANVKVMTWRESQAVPLGAIENEKALVTTLFGLISLVAVFLIFCIFYMIVVEKTRDIGIVKSVGATSTGVAMIFLGYGLAIGIVGSLLGLGLGYLIVTYINEIHTWLGHFGLVIWNPEVYMFDSIPNTMDMTEAAWIIAVAIASSVVGALLPAIRAARLNPVEALRWE